MRYLGGAGESGAGREHAGGRVLFVCSGNVFRSVSAERIFRARMPPGAGVSRADVSSAGTHAVPQFVRQEVALHLSRYEVSVADHMPRRVDEALLATTDLVVSMSYDHRTFLLEHFGRASVLFNEVAVGADTPILDVGEATPPWRDDPVLANAHATRVIDYLWAVMPQFVENLPAFLGSGDRGTLAAGGAA